MENKNCPKTTVIYFQTQILLQLIIDDREMFDLVQKANVNLNKRLKIKIHCRVYATVNPGLLNMYLFS